MFLKNKTAIISGGSKGIGLEIAKTYAQNGANVVICSRQKENLDLALVNAKREGVSLNAITCNTAESNSIKKVVDYTLERFSTIDILVNNAATSPYFGPIMKSTEKDWDRVFKINVQSYFEFAQQCFPSMQQNKHGKIINIGSVAGKTPMDGLGIYSVSKSAVMMLTKVLAKELAPDNIHVNAILPGLIKTNFSKALWDNEKISNDLLKMIPMGRIGEPKDIVGIALYLASEKSNFITGSLFSIDGGLTT